MWELRPNESRHGPLEEERLVGDRFPGADSPAAKRKFGAALKDQAGQKQAALLTGGFGERRHLPHSTRNNVERYDQVA